ncbi:MAG: HAD family hydrolase [Minwuia sp.]|uniref:HAD family hydrolase n=1 Tax=Minwuia sp. TaxID=2493630 RepID=UPI003A8A5E6B
MGAPDTVLFDLGNVLVDWNPRHLYRKLFAGRPREMEHFLTHVCNAAWNERHDAGVPFDENVAELAARHPWYRTEIEAFWTRWPETMKGEIAGSVGLLERLSDAGVAVHALTNWSAETFPHAENAFPWLDRFGHVVVSGRIGIKKPDPAIFHHAAETCPLEPSRTLFVDDSARNIAAATDLGFHAHHFQGPGGLEDCLKGHGLL